MIKGLIILLLSSSTAIAGTIYKYKNSDGITVYSDSEPVNSTNIKAIEPKDLPPLLITQPEKVQKKSAFTKHQSKKTQQRDYQNGECRHAIWMLNWIKKEIKRRSSTWTIEQLRDGKRKYTDLKHKHCI
tara:strand:- start:3778 stop:4164 length:387 start_codon:yes stop_codon:yes gene_type:complete